LPRIFILKVQRVLKKDKVLSVYRTDIPNLYQANLQDGSVKYVDLQTGKEVQAVKPSEQAIPTKQEEPKGFISRSDIEGKEEKPKKSTRKKKDSTDVAKPVTKRKKSTRKK